MEGRSPRRCAPRLPMKDTTLAPTQRCALFSTRTAGNFPTVRATNTWLRRALRRNPN